MEGNVYKELKLSVQDALEAIKVFAINLNGQLESEEKSGNCYQIKIIIPGAATASLALYDTKKGLTINPGLGKNQQLSKQIADILASRTVKVSDYNKTVCGIHECLFNELVEFLLENSSEIVKKDLDTKIQLHIKRGKYELAAHWYRRTNNLHIQGKTSNLLDDLLIWVGDKVINDPKQIIDLLFESFDAVENQKILYPDNIIDDELSKKLGAAYSDRRIISDHEKKWLQTSCYLCTLKIELPEYYAAVSSSIKVVEGLLRRLCHHKFGAGSFEGKNFAQFVGGSNTLRPEFRTRINDNDAIQCLENLYSFIATKRHAYQHTDGINPALVATREIALDIFDEVINLLVQMNRNSTKLL